MEIKKEVILDYVSENKEKNNYIIMLYKNFDTINSVFSEKKGPKYKILKAYEDEVYKINNKTMSERNRVLLELNQKKIKIARNPEKYMHLIDSLNEIEHIIDEIDFYDVESNIVLKKKISILQAKVDISPSFFYASYLAFEELYRNIYINHIKNGKNNRRFK